jgi:hypothetical protein
MACFITILIQPKVAMHQKYWSLEGDIQNEHFVPVHPNINKRLKTLPQQVF